jgi:hypothetical protein
MPTKSVLTPFIMMYFTKVIDKRGAIESGLKLQQKPLSTFIEISNIAINFSA